ncbi:MAG TPA: rRNA maturation RNase YbeY [Ktedonobacterales bacterium]|jgi:probable rRNA maturation factor|nr:rRNA maturation RNase YbeY [Ktedonobacterales bacterium]
MAEHAEIEFELAIISEPEGTELADIEGVSDELALRVVGLTLARAAVAQPIEISLLMTSDEHIRELNRDFRGKDEATDVLSFPLLDEPLVDAPTDELWQSEEGDVPPAALNGASMPTVHGGVALGNADDADYDEVEDDDDEAGLDVDDAELDGEDDDLGPEETALHLGDVAISRDTLARQAEQAGHSLAWEFAYLLAHGVLHLVGYDDRTEAGYRAMVAHQAAVLVELGISH